MANKRKKTTNKYRSNFLVNKFNNRFRLAVFVFLVAIAGVITLTATRADTNKVSNNNVTFFYQKIGKDFDSSRLGGTKLVVTSAQGTAADEEIAVRKIHDTGAKAYRYVQGIWFPAGRSLQDIDLAKNSEWRFCGKNGPIKGREVNGVSWWIFDLNEKEARNAVTRYLRKVKDWGYDGVFIDMGNAAIKPGARPDIPLNVNSVSTCTQNPVVKGRTFAEAYIGMATQAKGVGLEAMLNYSKPNQNPKLPSGWYNYLTSTFDEETNQSTDWNQVFLTNLSAQNSKKETMMVKSSVTDARLRRNDIYYRWARAKLFNVPVTINTGDDECPSGQAATGEAACLRYGVYPELTGAELGNAFKENGLEQPDASYCNAGSAISCLWIRHYQGGVVLVNNTNTAITLPINHRLSDCRYITDVWSKQKLANGTCVTKFSATVPARSGRVITYSIKP